MKTDLVVTGYVFNEDKVLLIHHKKLNMWLPVGGHIEPNETPDDALIREIKEETNLDVKFLNHASTPLIGNVKRNLATPFYANVHSVDDHDHCSLFYICKAINPEQLKLNDELTGFMWVEINNLKNYNEIQPDIKIQILKAFEILKENELRNSY